MSNLRPLHVTRNIRDNIKIQIEKPELFDSLLLQNMYILPNTYVELNQS